MNRREFLNTAGVLGAGLALSNGGANLSAAQGAATVAEDAPAAHPKFRNVLLLLVDQQRADCLGCYGNPVVRTPHLDRLAATGIRFENAFTPTPVCTPARTSLQTGLWAHHHGLRLNTGKFCEYGGGRQEVAPGTPFFANALRQAGWNLGHVGKWHIGKEKDRPEAYGYEGVYYPGYGYPSQHAHYQAFLEKHGVDGFRTHDEVRDPSGLRLYSAVQEGPIEASIPMYLASQTCDMIRHLAGRDEPFFASCNWWGPHAPYIIPQPHYDLYKDARIEPWPHFDCDLSDKPDVIRRYGEYWKTGWFTRENLPALIACYYGYISLIDESIGRILETLEETGEIERTLILYTADHGASVGAYRIWDKGFGMYDCITRVPMIASHPSVAPSVSDAFVSLIDLAPTFCEIAGCAPAEPMDGVSLRPVLEGGARSVRGDHIVSEHFGHQLPYTQRMLRTHGAKYIHNPTGPDEFYDLEADPWETRNLIGKVGEERVKGLRERLRAWMEQTRDPVFFWSQTMI